MKIMKLAFHFQLYTCHPSTGAKVERSSVKKFYMFNHMDMTSHAQSQMIVCRMHVIEFGDCSDYLHHCDTFIVNVVIFKFINVIFSSENFNLFYQTEWVFPLLKPDYIVRTPLKFGNKGEDEIFFLGREGLD